MMFECGGSDVTPEQLFVDSSQCGAATQSACSPAISAVKALQIAENEGQKLFTITQDNIDRALPLISAGQSVIEDIQNAVAVGKKVIVHEKSISAFGWHGTGYAVLDPTTGTGSYLISGGANGAIAFALGAITADLMALAVIGGMVGGPAAVMAMVGFGLPLIIPYVLAVKNFLWSGSTEEKIDKIKCFAGGLVMTATAILTAGTVLPAEVVGGAAIKEVLEQKILAIIGWGISIPEGASTTCFGVDLIASSVKWTDE